jgi:hypothetical protein
MFPQHKLVFVKGAVTIYDLRDTKKQNPVASISLLAMAPGAHAFVQMAAGKPPARFAVVKSYASERMLLKAIEAEYKFDGKAARVSLKDREAVTAKVNGDDFDTCLRIVAQHFTGSIDADLMQYVTTQAKKTFNYALTKLGKKASDGFGWNRAIQQMHGREEKPVGKTIAQIAAESPEIKTGKPTKAQLAAKPIPKRAPRDKNQNDLALISEAINPSLKNTKGPIVAQVAKTIHDGKTKAARAGKAKPKLPAHVETLKDFTDANKKTRTGKIDPLKWSVADEKIHEGVMQDLQHLTLRLNEINAARLAGLSIEAYDKKQKAKK